MRKGGYPCDICRRDFTRLDQLRRHLMATHKDDPERQRAIENAGPKNRPSVVQISS